VALDAVKYNLVMNIVRGNQMSENFLFLRQMLVVVQVFAWYIVLRNLVSDYF
jgi:hypothetical protein